MSRPYVEIREVDLSTRVPQFAGVYGAIVLPAKKGEINTPFLVTSEEHFLNQFTPDGKVEVGYSLGYYSALAYLQKSNKLWVVRAGNTSDTHYAGVSIQSALTSGSFNSASNSALSGDNLNDDSGVDAYVFGATDTLLIYASSAGDWGNNVAVEVWEYRERDEIDVTPAGNVDATSNEITGVNTFVSGEPVRVYTSGNSSTLPTGLNSGSIYYTVAGASNTQFGLALTYDDAIAGTKINLTDDGTGTMIVEPVNEVKAGSGAFLINVFKSSNLETPVEQWECSLDEAMKDGYGQNIYVEDVLKSSAYIRALDNGLVADSDGIKTQPKPLLLADGADGSAVTDTEMLVALDTLKNSREYPVTLIMDGGWTTVAYQKQGLLAFCENRKDCFALLSVPYSAEVSSNYLNEIVNYRRTTLNANSSYGALYAGHLSIRDKFNDRDIWVSPEGFMGALISATASNQEIWFPVAGFRRGILKVNDVSRHFEDGEMDYLYDNGINPIWFTVGKGIVAWGQKTLLARPSSLDRINVRLLLIVIEPAIAEALEDFIFEFNTVTTRSIIKTMIDEYMEGIMARQGVIDWYTVCDETNNTPNDIDNHILNVHLFVKPTQSIEYVKFTTVITRTGMDFQLAEQAIA